MVVNLAGTTFVDVGAMCSLFEAAGLARDRGSRSRRRVGTGYNDRVVQAALKLVLEPIFEADFLPRREVLCQHRRRRRDVTVNGGQQPDARTGRPPVSLVAMARSFRRIIRCWSRRIVAAAPASRGAAAGSHDTSLRTHRAGRWHARRIGVPTLCGC